MKPLNNYWYECLGIILLFAYLAHCFYGFWTGDFWEHAATIKELATNLIHPKHPLFGIDVPHPFFSPYSLLLSIFMKLSGVSNPINVLAFMGLVNLILFLFIFRKFLKIFLNMSDALIALSLFLILFMWPLGIYEWSSFFDFEVLFYVLPYPSTFCFTLTLLVFICYYIYLTTFKNYFFVCIIIFFMVFILLTHLPTFIWTLCGLTSITVVIFLFQKKSNILLLFFVILGSTIFLACLWPYYSIFSLVLANNQKFHLDSLIFYYNYKLVIPSLIFFAFCTLCYIIKLFFERNLLYAFNKGEIIFLVMFFISLSVYFLGYIFNLYGIGRIISFIQIISQVLTANFLYKFLILNKKKSLFLILCLCTILVFSVVKLSQPPLLRAYKFFSGKHYSYNLYMKIAKYVQHYDIVLANVKVSWPIPSFSGKIVASLHPTHWINNEIRKKDVSFFFSKETSLDERKRIIDKYKVKFVLINKDDYCGDYNNLGKIIFQGLHFVFLKVFKH